MNRFLFTSESVTEGHPDKICDQISDAVLDAILEQDSKARVACETVVTTGMVLCMGEISTTAKVDIPQIARDVIVDIGYDRAKFGFDGYTCSVLQAMDKQSPDIAMGVNDAYESRGGDVRLCVQGNKGTDAAGNFSRTQALHEVDRCTERKGFAVSPSRWQGTGNRRICRRQAKAD